MCKFLVLFQTSDQNEVQQWIDAINFVAATFSTPALPTPGTLFTLQKFIFLFQKIQLVQAELSPSISPIFHPFPPTFLV